MPGNCSGGITATLSALTLGSLTLTPTFDPEVTEYSANTADATNKITATADEGIEITITLNGDPFTNGNSATWEQGENTVVIVASGEGMVSTTYTITVTAQQK